MDGWVQVDVDESLLSSEQLEALSSIDGSKSLGRYRYTKLNMLLDKAVGDIVDALKVPPATTHHPPAVRPTCVQGAVH